jgi:hypothetical protein
VKYLGKDEYEVPLETKNRMIIKVVSGSLGLSLTRVTVKFPEGGDGSKLQSLYSATLRDGDFPYMHYRW